MENEQTFIYSYSAKENAELQAIRQKYLPREESKLEELKRLDGTVQAAGMIESLSVGTVGALVFGLGLCLAMQVIGSGAWMMALGVLLGLVGMAVMFLAYPVYRKIFTKTKEKLALRILELAEELLPASAE